MPELTPELIQTIGIPAVCILIGAHYAVKIVLSVIKALQPQKERRAQTPETIADAVIKRMNGSLKNLENLHNSPCPDLIGVMKNQESVESKLTQIIQIHETENREQLFKKFSKEIVDKLKDK